MKYDAHMSMTLNQDIYVMKSGAIYLQYKGNQHLIGTVGQSSMAELRNAIEEYLPC